jgi:hypothetical protein
MRVALVWRQALAACPTALLWLQREPGRENPEGCAK